MDREACIAKRVLEPSTETETVGEAELTEKQKSRWGIISFRPIFQNFQVECPVRCWKGGIIY